MSRVMTWPSRGDDDDVCTSTTWTTEDEDMQRGGGQDRRVNVCGVCCDPPAVSEAQLWGAFDMTLAECCEQEQQQEPEWERRGVRGLGVPSRAPGGKDAYGQRCTFCVDGGHTELRDNHVVCTKCATIVERCLDDAPEWRYYGADDTRSVNPTRCCPPGNALFSSSGNTALVKTAGAARHGGQPSFPGRSAGLARALQRFQQWNSLTRRESRMYHAFTGMTACAASHGIPGCILEEAKALYARALEFKPTRGAHRQALGACSVYVACKTNGVPRSAREVATIFGVPLPAMTRGCKLFDEMLRASTHLACTRASDFIPRVCSRLGITVADTLLCKSVTEKAEEMGIADDSTPPSLAAAAILLCCEHDGTDVDHCRRIAEACHVSPVTVGKFVYRLRAYEATLLPEQLIKNKRANAAATTRMRRQLARANGGNQRTPKKLDAAVSGTS